MNEKDWGKPQPWGHPNMIHQPQCPAGTQETRSRAIWSLLSGRGEDPPKGAPGRWGTGWGKAPE